MHGSSIKFNQNKNNNLLCFFFFFEEENPLGKEMHDEG